jgi:hypothetical protein
MHAFQLGLSTAARFMNSTTTRNRSIGQLVPIIGDVNIRSDEADDVLPLYRVFHNDSYDQTYFQHYYKSSNMNNIVPFKTRDFFYIGSEQSRILHQDEFNWVSVLYSKVTFWAHSSNHVQNSSIRYAFNFDS